MNVNDDRRYWFIQLSSTLVVKFEFEFSSVGKYINSQSDNDVNCNLNAIYLHCMHVKGFARKANDIISVQLIRKMLLSEIIGIFLALKPKIAFMPPFRVVRAKNDWLFHTIWMVNIFVAVYKTKWWKAMVWISNVEYQCSLARYIKRQSHSNAKQSWKEIKKKNLLKTSRYE